MDVDGIYFLAPACRIELFESHLLPLYRSGKIKAYTQFHLTDKVERQDTCIGIYRRSLLYLVSNAFEGRRGTPILGMEAYFAKTPSLTTQRPAKASVWDVIASPTSPTDPTKRSNSTSHGGFDDDDDTRIAVIERIIRRQSPAPTGAAAARRSTRVARKTKT